MYLHFIFSISLLLLLVGQAPGIPGIPILLRRLAERRYSNDLIAEKELLNLQQRAPQKPNVDANKFLEKFGYLPSLPSDVSHDPAARTEAIRQFQKMYNLKQTGRVDEETINAMMAPRCGFPDTTPKKFTEPDSENIERRYFVPGSYKWQKNDLTYRFRNFASTTKVSQQAQRRAIERAFQFWSDVSPLTFRETSEPRGDLNLEFSTAAHNDGPQNAFDGPGGVLAHAFYPMSGETHFDDQEDWVDSKVEGVDLMTVAAHELGHALGIGHSSVPGALMAPYYQGYDPEFVSLPQDDIDAIQSLYGPKPQGNKPVVTKRPTQPPPTTSTTTTTFAPMVTVPDGRPDTCAVPFRALTQIHDNSIMVFNGQWLWRLTESGLDSDYPINTRNLYKSAPVNIDAAIYSRNTYYTYLFYGKMVWRYHGFELISGHNIATQTFSGSVNDVLTDSSGNLYLIKGSDCWLFDEYDLHVQPQPRPCSQLFPGMPSAIDSALQLVDEPNIIYFFRGVRYFKYNIQARSVDPGYPKLKAAPWLGSVCGGAPNSPK